MAVDAAILLDDADGRQVVAENLGARLGDLAARRECIGIRRAVAQRAEQVDVNRRAQRRRALVGEQRLENEARISVLNVGQCSSH